jgi:ribosomal protein S18 acetylase RimI-like enzyme
MSTEVRRIARMRFGTEYWPAIDAALQNCLESHSVVINTSNDDKPTIAAFVLVCPPTTGSKTSYGIEQKVPSNALEIAFVATDEGWEGCGFARSLLEAVLFRCKTAQQSAWLHVDTINPKAHAFYERLGFRDFLHIPDPLGSPGVVMLFSHKLSYELLHRPRRHEESIQWPTLLNASPCETEEPFRRSILAPPTMACV